MLRDQSGDTPVHRASRLGRGKSVYGHQLIATVLGRALDHIVQPQGPNLRIQHHIWDGQTATLQATWSLHVCCRSRAIMAGPGGQ